MDKEISEIAKLTARISKDPKSKLFVPLAEEYKKAGDIDMAIHVLLEGLKRNPEYVIARSSLGKLLIAKGDLAGAQQEFENVVKTSPDNLMAQKKLGDLLILQDRPQDALSHYKIALSLNPDDGELTCLMSDIEAGQDVRSKIQVPKVKTAEGQAVKQEPPSPAASPRQTQDFSPSPPSNVGSKTQIETPPVSPTVSLAPAMEMGKTPAFSTAETEEPEEVLVVEPLEPEISMQEPAVTVLDLPEVNEQPVTPSIVADESFNFDFPADGQLSDEPVASEDILNETDMLKGDDKGAIATDVSEETAADEIMGTGFGEGGIEQFPEPSIGDISEQSDDFTTDTLAELYISQGFFEKAIEIYERMLADKPNSRGLLDKLSLVRAEIVRTEAPAPEPILEEDIFFTQNTGEDVPVAEEGEAVTEPPLEDLMPQQNEAVAGITPEAATQAGDYVPTFEPDEMLIEAEVIPEQGEFAPAEKQSEEKTFSDSGEYNPASEQKGQETTGGNALINVFTASPVQEPQHSDFEPREYVPPDQKRKLPEATFQLERATRVPDTAGRKETIARLESWLTIIKKEK